MPTTAQEKKVHALNLGSDRDAGGAAKAVGPPLDTAVGSRNITIDLCAEIAKAKALDTATAERKAMLMIEHSKDVPMAIDSARQCHRIKSPLEKNETG